MCDWLINEWGRKIREGKRFGAKVEKREVVGKKMKFEKKKKNRREKKKVNSARVELDFRLSHQFQKSIGPN